MKQQEALDILRLGHNVFLTGAAGSGKTHTLNMYISSLKEKGVAVGVTASTGIAATHMNGITIHSWSGIGIKNALQKKDITKLAKRKYIRDHLLPARVLVIDEVSMLHHFQLDLVDEVCRGVRENSMPFGGLQVVLCGDFFQLPPVVRDGKQARFVYESRVWQEMDLKICYLQEQYRQEDNALLNILSDIRSNNVSDETLGPLRGRYRRDIEGNIVPTKLYTHNIDVDTINNRELKKISGKERVYEMNGKGKRVLVDALKKSCLAPETLRLKKDAVVMFVKNNFEEGYVNGTLGVVKDFDEYDQPIVRLKNGKEITVQSASWLIEEDGEKKAEIYQLPLRLAWAITVHKSQGMSLDAAEIDLSKSFVAGMGYVALSRVRTLAGLKLMGFNQEAARVNDSILEFDTELMKISTEVASELRAMDKEDIKEKQKVFSDSIAPKKKEKKLSTYEQTKLLIEKKLTIQEMAKKRGMTIGTIISHLEKLREKGEDIDIKYLQPPTENMKKIKAAFLKTGDTKLSPVRTVLKNKYSYEDLRLARLFLD